MKHGESLTETFDKVIKVFGNKAISCAQGFQWHKKFKNGQGNDADKTQNGKVVKM